MTPLLVGAFVAGLLVAHLPPEGAEAPPPQSNTHTRNLSVSFLAPAQKTAPFGNVFDIPPLVVRTPGASVTLVHRSGSSWNCGMPVVPARPDIDPKIAKPAPSKGHIKVVPPAECGK